MPAITLPALRPERFQPWVWFLALYVALFLFQGFSESDIPDFQIMAQDMTRVLAPENRQFLYSSPLNYMLGDLIGLPTPFGFYFIHLEEIVGMLVAVIFAVRKKFPDTQDQIHFYSLLALTPLWLVTLKWIGKPDPVLIAMMFIGWAWPGRVRYICATVMVIAHREMGSFMCGFLFLADARNDFGLLAPVAVGNAFHYIYENYVLDFRPASRVANLTFDIWRHPREFAHRPVVYFLTSFSWYWVVLITKRPNMRLGFSLALAWSIAVVCEDFTRDFVLMALAPLLFHLESVVKSPEAARLQRYVPLALLQLQIAGMGNFFKPDNILVDWITGNIGFQLTR